MYIRNCFGSCSPENGGTHNGVVLTEDRPAECKAAAVSVCCFNVFAAVEFILAYVVYRNKNDTADSVERMPSAVSLR